MTKQKALILAGGIWIILFILGRFFLAHNALSTSDWSLKNAVSQAGTTNEVTPNTIATRPISWPEDSKIHATLEKEWSLSMLIPNMIHFEALIELSKYLNETSDTNIQLNITQARNRADYESLLFNKENKFDIIISSSLRRDSIEDSTMTLPLNPNIYSLFPQSAKELIWSNYSFIPIWFDPLIVFSDKKQTKDALYRSDIESYLLSNTDLMLGFGVWKIDEKFILAKRHPFPNYAHILSTLLFTTLNNSEYNAITKNILETTNTLRDFKSIYKASKDEDVECNWDGYDCLLKEGKINIWFSTLSALYSWEKRSEIKNKYTLYPLANSEKLGTNVRWFNILNTTEKKSLALSRILEYLKNGANSNTELRSNNISAFNANRSQQLTQTEFKYLKKYFQNEKLEINTNEIDAIEKLFQETPLSDVLSWTYSAQKFTNEYTKT